MTMTIIMSINGSVSGTFVCGEFDNNGKNNKVSDGDHGDKDD